MARTKEEQIRRVAHELYQRRLLLSRSGDAESDWRNAEAVVHNPVKNVLFNLSKTGRAVSKIIVWETPRWFLYSLPQMEWVKLLAVPLVLGVAGSIITSQIQREANQNAVLKSYFDQLETLTFEHNLLSETPAPGVIVLARGRTVAALRELDLTRKAQLIAFLQASGMSSIGEDGTQPIISFNSQNLSNLDLRGTNLSRMDFSKAELSNTNLQSTFLPEANLQDANLSEVNLQNAILGEVNLQNAILGEVNLQNAILDSANLQNALLLDVDLKSADLGNANLQDTFLHRSNLRDTNLKDAVFIATNLENVRNLIEDQLEGERSPLLCNVNFPPNITNVSPIRDCEILPQILVERYEMSLEEADQIIEEAKQKQWD